MGVPINIAASKNKMKPISVSMQQYNWSIQTILEGVAIAYQLEKD